MKNENIYLTFKTDKETAWLLTQIAHKFGKTQPELINKICQNYIISLLNEVDKDLAEQYIKKHGQK